jgi:hypothetical protein
MPPRLYLQVFPGEVLEAWEIKQSKLPSVELANTGNGTVSFETSAFFVVFLIRVVFR